MANSRFIRILLCAVSCCLLAACGGGDNEESDTPTEQETTNQAPVSSAGDNIVTSAGAVVTLDGSASHDPEGSGLTYRWVQISGRQVALSDITSAQPQFIAPDATGTTLTFQLGVTDGSQFRVDNVEVYILPINADAGEDQVVMEGNTVTLDASQSRLPQGETPVYSWVQVSGPDVALDQDNVAQPTFSLSGIDSNQTVVFELRLSIAGADFVVTDTVDIEVKNLEAPSAVATANAGIDIEAEDLSTIILDGSESLATGDSISSYFWTQVSDGTPQAQFLSRDEALVSVTLPNVEEATNVTFMLTVTDSSGNWSSDLVGVKVSDVNNPGDELAGLNCTNLSHNKVYLLGTLQEGSASRGALLDPVTDQFCLAPDSLIPTITKSGRLLVENDTSIYRVVPEWFTTSNGNLDYPTDQLGNDELVLTATATGCGIGLVMTNPTNDDVFYSCPSGTIHTESAPSYYDLANDELLAVLPDGSMLVGSYNGLRIVNEAMVETTLTLPAHSETILNFLTAKQFVNPGTGNNSVWIALPIGDQIHRWRLDLVTQEIVDQGAFAGLPDNIANGSSPRLDVNGDLWQIATDTTGSFIDVIVKRPLADSGSQSEVIYTEADSPDNTSWWLPEGTPFVFMHGSRLVTGP